MNSGENQAKNCEAAVLVRRAANLLNTDSSTSINLESSNSNSCDQADQGARQGVQQSPQLNTHPVQPQPRLTQAPASSSSSNSVSNEEFRRLFAPYNRVKNGRMLSQPPAKRGRANSWRQGRYFKPQETWTHDFCCLASHVRNCVPTRMEKLKLQKAGLGRRRISFHKDSNAISVKAKLEEVYPRLVSGGGFEILRSGLSPKDLQLLTPPSNSGYSVQFLRDVSGLGQVIAYVRLVQADLDSSPLDLDIQIAEAPTTKVFHIHYVMTRSIPTFGRYEMCCSCVGVTSWTKSKVFELFFGDSYEFNQKPCV